MSGKFSRLDFREDFGGMNDLYLENEEQVANIAQAGL